ncbi:MAG: DUF3467 domain-containing protein [Candidatus Aenigmarchaeota archaeon]|nr:DUF3467 domain-containing protein [Candidatus Aenigmarchaeota archaeon]
MGEEKKRVNMNIDQNKEVFYSNNLAVFNNPTEFILDFTQITPRIDMVQDKQMITYVVKHNAIVLEPAQAKIFFNLLKENLEKYEKKFGKIKLPKGGEKVKKEGLAKRFSEYIG